MEAKQARDPAADAAETGGYEFDAEQNELIADLARKMLGVGTFLFLIGALALLGAVASGLGSRLDAAVVLVFAAAFFLAVASWTTAAAKSFRKIVETEGSDIPHTMAALAQLRRFYTLHFWLILAYLVLIVLAVLGYPEGLG